MAVQSVFKDSKSEKQPTFFLALSSKVSVIETLGALLYTLSLARQIGLFAQSAEMTTKAAVAVVNMTPCEDSDTQKIPNYDLL